MGRLNMRTLLSRLQKVGMASRADLAKSLGMSQPTAGRIADELLELGVLEEVATQDVANPGWTESSRNSASRLGRPGRLLRLDSTRPRFLAIQLDVTKMSFALLPVGFKGEDQWEFQIPTPNSDKKLIERLHTAAAKIPQKNFWGVLVSVPGIVHESAGKVLFSPNLCWTEQINLPTLIQNVWNTPVVLVQEEQALALGHQSVEPVGEDFMLVDFSESVGGAVILEGRLFANPLPISGELGHTPVLGNQRVCGCGAVGCMESLVSIRGLLQSFAENHGERADNSWPALVRHIETEGVTPWLTDALDAAATAIAGALNVLGLRRVVITGTLAELPPGVVKYFFEAITRGALWARFGRVKCETATRRRMAGLVAVGIDRLVISMAESSAEETA
jgi:predicted NBD/HSP70 family sugar kinase